jgi:hypothetical protein
VSFERRVMSIVGQFFNRATLFFSGAGAMLLNVVSTIFPWQLCGLQLDICDRSFLNNCSGRWENRFHDVLKIIGGTSQAFFVCAEIENVAFRRYKSQA